MVAASVLNCRPYATEAVKIAELMPERMKGPPQTDEDRVAAQLGQIAMRLEKLAK